MAKTYNMGAELKTLGLTPVTKTPAKTKMGEFDKPVIVRTSNNVHYGGSVMPAKQQKAYNDYHRNKGKKR